MSEEEYVSEQEEEEEVEDELDDEEEEEDEAPVAKKGKAAKATKGGKSAPAKRKKDPLKPKGACSAYMCFMKAKRAEVVAATPGIAVTQVAGKVAELWHALSASDKIPYEKLAAIDKARYEKEKAAYVPEDDEDSGKKGGKRAKKDPNAPKRPLSAYFIFSNEKRATVKSQFPNLSVGDMAKKLAGLWGELNDAQKKPYADKAVLAKAQYEKDVAAYKK